MSNRLSDADLCHRAWEILAERLGLVETLRFLSLTRTQSRDYQSWRDQRFAGLRAADLLRQMAGGAPVTRDDGSNGN